MLKPWTEPFREALKAARASTREIAEEAGFARITFDAYLNRREPSRKAALALARVLEARGGELTRFAERIREACREAPGRGTS